MAGITPDVSVLRSIGRLSLGLSRSDKTHLRCRQATSSALPILLDKSPIDPKLLGSLLPFFRLEAQPLSRHRAIWAFTITPEIVIEANAFSLRVGDKRWTVVPAMSIHFQQTHHN
jgi:hypothetical protein